jgi:5'-deoxynucleotidase YfbR-like HD superfamily hydrolase
VIQDNHQRKDEAMQQRTGDWMQTYTGRQFWPLDPRAEEIEIEDIAHGLSMQCRYAGHCLRFYSVAEHSVLLSRALPEPFKLWGLLHDAAEAYVLDIIRPIKPSLPGYREIEEAVMVGVCQRFGLAPEMPEIVKTFDTRILVDEKRQNMAVGLVWGTDALEPLGVDLQYWSPAVAKSVFLSEFAHLTAPRS